ncbi:membrane fusion protein (multidrug efflux system) [Mucilaginibacter frigoritolerans]|jgi:membrane fusion protein, multidrug efflux system|uniref:Membrane fusion protein (Multidrug efflux system) n=1 Tax=Mucilaginibacter frigoritolerans TaxID=652788 RepID=A0A562UBT3_9SPHI|nr:efflux RND transporter periplasmic adaptor subunit [Mucilaginibacter frigoritolerans]TWJ03208.1 membrane fusion protein (multidrug efflux system) [Mucilaginibacter frigoritolerans]
MNTIPYKMKKNWAGLAMLSTAIIAISSCGGNANQAPGAQQPPAAYQVFTVTPQSATLHTSYPAVMQGEQTIDIRPKVDGYIEKIYVDEGSVVKKGQLLFKLNAPEYEQTVINSIAAINSAKADINSAEIAVNKTKPLVEKGIISEYELQTDQNTLDTKRAALAQAQTTLATAKVNLGYTYVTSPVNGVVGSIPYRLGSLITSTTASPLTTVANIGKVYAYFSLNEKQLLEFSRSVKGSTLDEKLKNTPDVNLALADGSAYPEKGRLETISGVLNTTTGSASFRAAFPNPLHLLRSGSSGNVDIPQALTDAVLVPQKSAYELQGKHFVYILGDNNLVKNQEIQIMELTAGQYYVVTGGLKAGDKIVYDGTISLKDSTKINPQPMDANKVYQDLKN